MTCKERKEKGKRTERKAKKEGRVWRFGSCITGRSVNDTASPEDNWTIGVKIKITH